MPRACRRTCCISFRERGETVGAALIRDPRIDGVAFTGGTDTGIAINRALAARDGPLVRLIAETGGQNCMIVDSSALPEQVVDDALSSAFDSAGQRCSALARALPPGGRGGEHDRHAARRGARARDWRSARLCDRCRAGDRRRGERGAGETQSAHAARGARAARSAFACRLARTARTSRLRSTQSPRSSCFRARCSARSCM